MYAVVYVVTVPECVVQVHACMYSEQCPPLPPPLWLQIGSPLRRARHDSSAGGRGRSSGGTGWRTWTDLLLVSRVGGRLPFLRRPAPRPQAADSSCRTQAGTSCRWATLMSGTLALRHRCLPGVQLLLKQPGLHTRLKLQASALPSADVESSVGSLRMCNSWWVQQTKPGRGRAGISRMRVTPGATRATRAGSSWMRVVPGVTTATRAGSSWMRVTRAGVGSNRMTPGRRMASSRSMTGCGRRARQLTSIST